MRSKNHNKSNRGALKSFQTSAKRTVLPLIKAPFLNNPYMRAFKIPYPVFTNNATSNYTFTSGSDVRFLAIQTVLNASNAFTNYLTNAFQYYTILGVTLEYLPIITNSGQALSTYLAPIISGVNENKLTPANPTNTVLQTIISYMTIPLTKLSRSVKQFAPSVNIFSTLNTTFNVKYDRSTLPVSGQIELGQDGSSVFPITVENIGILNVYVHCVFKTPIS
jgi:hypothetical protein